MYTFLLFLQQIVASDDESGDDAEAAFLASLTDKQKKKLLRCGLAIVLLFLCVLLRISARSISTECLLKEITQNMFLPIDCGRFGDV